MWPIRDSAATAPHFDRASLAALDERIDAHVDGLRIAGKQGLSVAVKAISEDEPGTAFAPFALAIELEQEDVIGALLELPAVSCALISALAFAPKERSWKLIEKLSATGGSPFVRRLALAGAVALRRDPGVSLSYAIGDRDLGLRVRALRAAGELGRHDLLPSLVEAMSAEPIEARYWASWSAALLGHEPAFAALFRLSEEPGVVSANALSLAVRRLDLRRAREALVAMMGTEKLGRAAVIAAGALGDPQLVTPLLEAMESPALARVAGYSLTSITGIEVRGGLESRAPEDYTAGPTDDPADMRVTMDPDEPLRWPSRAALSVAWAAREGDLRRGERYLLGLPMNEANLERAFSSGDQRLRRSVALELCLRKPGRPLLETRWFPRRKPA